METPPKDKKLEKLLDVLDGIFTTPDEIVEVVDTLIEAVGALVKHLNELFQKTEGRLNSAMGALSDRFVKLDERLTRELGSMDKRVKEVSKQKGPPGPPGPKGDTIPGPPGPPGPEGSPDTGIDIRTKLELLPEEERLSGKEALLEWEELMAAIEELRSRPAGRAGGPTGLRFLVDGVKKGIISNMNFKAGSGMAISYSKVDGQDTITFTPSGGGVTVSTPAESPDASRTTFTSASTPKWVVADGITYYEGAGYSYAGTTITMDVAPSATIRVIT